MKMTKEQAILIGKEIYEHSIKHGFPVIEKTKKGNKNTISKTKKKVRLYNI